MRMMSLQPRQRRNQQRLWVTSLNAEGKEEKETAMALVSGLA